MLTSTIPTRRPVAIMMLIMVLWQCLFVAVEAGAQVHLPTVLDDHHLAPHLEATPCADAQCPGHHIIGAVEEHGPVSDSCDHCCACQGHSAHVSIYTKAFTLIITPPGNLPVAVLPTFCSRNSTAIYRPPIA